LELLKLAESDTAGRKGRPKKPLKKEKTKRETSTHSRLHLTLSNKTLEKLKKLKDVKRLTSEEVIDHALELALKKYQKSLDTVRKSKATQVENENKGNRKRNIPAAIKKSVIKRSGHQCEFPGCGETQFLEFEHVIPFSKGGRHTPSNIKMFCKAHNQRAAIIQFGQVKMDKFFK